MDKLQRYKDQVAKERKAAMSNRNDYQKRIANLESELEQVKAENERLKKRVENLKCCANCNRSTDNSGVLTCQLNNEEVDINHYCEEWD